LAALVAGGKLFQARAAATGNAREERRVDGISSVVVFVERRRRRAGTSAVSWPLSAIDKLALCRARSGKPGHITGTRCTQELATS